MGVSAQAVGGNPKFVHQFSPETFFKLSLMVCLLFYYFIQIYLLDSVNVEM